jgi:hypothetical protein
MHGVLSWWWSFRMEMTPLSKIELPALLRHPTMGAMTKRDETMNPLHFAAALGVVP